MLIINRLIWILDIYVRHATHILFIFLVGNLMSSESESDVYANVCINILMLFILSKGVRIVFFSEWPKNVDISTKKNQNVHVSRILCFQNAIKRLIVSDGPTMGYSLSSSVKCVVLLYLFALLFWPWHLV